MVGPSWLFTPERATPEHAARSTRSPRGSTCPRITELWKRTLGLAHDLETPPDDQRERAVRAPLRAVQRLALDRTYVYERWSDVKLAMN